MKKKYLVALLSLLTINTAAFANSVYVGFQGGADFFSVKRTVAGVAVSPVPIPVPNMLFTTRNSGTGGVGGIFLGYSWRFPVSDLGLEVFGVGDTSNAKQNGTNLNFIKNNIATSEKMKGYYGVAVKPGYFVNDKAKIYAKIGAVRGRFSIQPTQAGFLGTTLTSTSTNSNWLGGFQLGAGTEIFLNPNLALTVEYNHIRYQRLNTSSRFVDQNAAEGVAGLTSAITTNYHPQSNNVLVGLTYYFNGLSVAPKDDGDYDI